MAEVTRDDELKAFRGIVAAGLLSTVAFALFLVSDVGSLSVQKLVSQLVLASAAGAASYMCARAAKRNQGLMRESWAYFALGTACWAIGRLAWMVMGSPPVTTLDLDIVHIPTLIFLGFCILALVKLDVLPAGNAARARAVLDGITTGTVIAFMAWTFQLRFDARDYSGGVLDRFGSVINPMADVVLATVCITVFGLTRTHRRLSYVSMALLALGIASTLISEVRFNVFGSNTHFVPGTIVDLGWFVGFVFMAFAAAWPRPSIRRRVNLHRSRFSEFLPGLAAAGVLTTLLAQVNRTGELDLVSEWLALCLIVCVLVRQVVTVLEEQRLSVLLEARVADRTEQLSRREQQFRALVQHSSDVIVIIREDGQFEYVSPSVQHVLGHPPEAVAEGNIADIILPEDRPRVMALLAMATRRIGATMTAEWRVVRADGTLRQVEVLVRNLISEPAVAGIVLNLRDVTERKELEDQLTHQALHDDLTGLANRSLLRVRVEQALARWLFQNEPFSLVVVDLDDFKSINDSLGHVAGDEVLKTVAERIGYCTRRGDTIVRLAADEFAVLLEGVAADDPEAHNVAQRIIHGVQQPMRIEGRTIAMRVSIGLACVTNQVGQADDIMRNADLALHVAKLEQRGGYVQFEPGMHDSAVRRVEMEVDLRRAIERNELELYYQPTVDIATGALEGVEALLRWPHSEKGFISPADFIPLAEESGLIVPIGTWVLRQACTEIASWQNDYPGERPLVLNVNLSARQLDQIDVVETVSEILEESGLDPSTLVLEMTESVLMENKPTTLAKMENLVGLGVELAIDDFGTGYSSLSYLRQFPIGVLKIDRSFVMGVGGSNEAGEPALVQAIIDLARSLQLKTVAEGIETNEQYESLKEMGCDVGQGYLFAKPAPPAQIRELIERTRGVNAPLAPISSPS